MRFGLCCLFVEEKISFRTTTAKALLNLTVKKRLEKVSGICLHNAKSLLESVKTVHRLGIGAFRISSQFFPRMTHPVTGYRLEELPEVEEINDLLAATKNFSKNNGIRLSFHPDQFIMLSSPREEVTENSIRELCCQADWAEAVRADVINIHAGGVYGNKTQALERLSGVFKDLPEKVSSRLTLENDDISYTVRDLLPVCHALSIPLVYDVHHHRCNPDGLTELEATDLAAGTWAALKREQYCHISSPKNGWSKGNPKPHADFVDPKDFPTCWLEREMTVDVEAKAKELAVARLMGELGLVRE
ncbi:UV DNA damage repair endonuclease UvsE [Solidesulfovibrio magneticus]|uniref:UV DNA damage endonuclease n=1 Tax=Solidesulfovibrio magneticus (strain ATCC 700980 / DSM 13731 / RS-1) TaxID=573370 RepID=C4XM15_SOLM1|nr:UV DNA damage repair endonuclease UvsE [Solidesulfovibrio magneticus]BAH77143.1 UV DNA damage endonuclease [Solidesulfovibrio magneticus RS-1]